MVQLFKHLKFREFDGILGNFTIRGPWMFLGGCVQKAALPVLEAALNVQLGDPEKTTKNHHFWIFLEGHKGSSHNRSPNHLATELAEWS